MKHDTKRALAKIDLTEQQRGFVIEFIKSNGTCDVACRNAGISGSYGLQLLKQTKILEAIRKFVLMEFQADAVLARSVLVDVMKDEETPPMVRRQCAMDILTIASLDLPYTAEGENGLGSLNTTNLSEAEKDQLEDLLAKMQRDPITDADAIEGESHAI